MRVGHTKCTHEDTSYVHANYTMSFRIKKFNAIDLDCRVMFSFLKARFVFLFLFLRFPRTTHAMRLQFPLHEVHFVCKCILCKCITHTTCTSCNGNCKRIACHVWYSLRGFVRGGRKCGWVIFSIYLHVLRLPNHHISLPQLFLVHKMRMFL